jgi:hypothetical protein
MTDVTDVADDARERLRNARGFIFDMTGRWRSATG